MNYPQLLIDSIFQHIPSYLFWKDTDSIYLGCNEHYAKLLGLNHPNEIIGKTDSELGWLEEGDTAEKFRQGDRATLAGQPLINEEELLVSKSGAKILALVSKVPLHNAAGQIVGVLGIATDITDKQKLQEKLAQTQYQLRGMLILSASITHELRTPLAALKNACLGIEKTLPSLLQAYAIAEQHGLELPFIPHQKLELLQAITARSSKMVDQCNAIINMLITNISTHTQGTAIKLEICSAAACIEEALESYPFPQTFSQDRIHWQSCNDFQFKGQKLLIIHVLFNLLKNAIYFTHKANKGDITIWLEQHTDDNAIHFKDTGTGIQPQYLPHIFDCFYTKDTNKGSGIGLAFCDLTLQQIGGSIECRSEYQKFTEFILKFPTLTH
ncbi:MAG: PAS domain-containing sensor histidine kinase [Gammaproteobacteria bacterium]